MRVVSTKINIIVDSGGLSEKLKEQQEIARQAYLEEERTRRAEAESTEQRVARLASEGRDTQNQPIIGNPGSLPSREDEPNAFRSDLGPTVGTFWDFYSRGGTAEALGPTGWFYRFNTGRIDTFNTTTFGQGQNHFFASGSGKQHLTISTLDAARRAVFTTGERVPLGVIESYGYGPPTYSLSRRTYVFGGTAINSIRSNMPSDSFFLPTGGGNAIFVYILREIASQYVFNIGAYYFESFSSSGVSQGTTPFAADGNPTINFTFDDSGQYSYTDPTGVTRYATVPKGVSGFTIKKTYNERYLAFAVNKDTIREITFPPSLKAAHKAKWPETVYTNVTVAASSNGSWSDTDYNWASIPLVGNWYSSHYTQTGYQASVAVSDYEIRVASPEIFKLINTDIGFTDPSNIKEYDPSKYKAIVQDRSQGMFSRYANADCSSGTSFEDNSTSNVGIKTLYGSYDFIDFAIWKKKGEVPDYSVFNTAGCPITPTLPPVIKNKKARTKMFAGRDPVPNPLGYAFENLIAIYDGGDPKYCQSMCLALGFSSSDFKP